MRDSLFRLFPDLRRVPLPAYVVGGAIRDLLLGREPKDVDVASPDPLTAARAVGEKVIRLGKGEHLSAYRVVRGPHVYDFAELLDGDIDVDLARRDFTVNAMALDLATDALIDPHGGRRDLAARVVRMVSAENFDDDPLRMLKAVRMAVTHDFRLDEATIAAIRPRAMRINEVAAERVTFELSLIFAARQSRTAAELLRKTELDVALFGREFPPLDRDDVAFELAMAMVIDDPRAYGERWRWSESFVRDVMTLRKLMRQHDVVTLYDAGERLARMLPDVDTARPDFTIRPMLTGDEIASLTGLAAGPELGRVKRALLEAQIRGEVKTRQEAEAFVRLSPRA